MSMKMLAIDAHQHFWKPARADYGWLTAKSHPLICHDCMPEDLAPCLEKAGIEKTILVQAAPTIAETDFLLGIAAETEFVAAVVGWADFEAPDAADTIATLAARPKLAGLRPMIQDIMDDNWMLSRRISHAIRAMIANKLRFDALVKPWHLENLITFLKRWPELPLVIDHGAKPGIAAGARQPWAGNMRRIARETHAVCKLSGLVTEAGAGWTVERLKPFVDVLIDQFGPSRLMWGSDWPVLIENGDYERWHEAALTLTHSLTEAERNAIFGETAARFYGVAQEEE